MSDLRVNAAVSVDGKQASDELKKIVGGLSDAKVELDKAQRAAKAASAELRALNTTTAEGAARAGQLKTELRDLTLKELQAADAHKAATAALNSHNAALGRATTSTGQMRASSANLGQQIGDISQGLALGVQPMTIFAQQGGQVAYAMSGMGGAVGRAATFLSGPWGAALLGATIVATPFIDKLFETGEGARVARDGTVSFATEAGIAIKGLGDVAAKGFDPLAAGFERAIAKMRAKLPDLRSVIAGALKGIDDLNAFGAKYFGTDKTNYASDYEAERKRQIAMLRAEDTEKALNKGQFGTAFVDSLTDGKKNKADVAAERAAADAARKTAEATREAARTAKALADENANLANTYGGAAAAAAGFAAKLADIAKAQGRGLITGSAAAGARYDAYAAFDKTSRDRTDQRLSEGGSTLRSAGDAFGENVLKRIGDGGLDIGAKVAQGFSASTLADAAVIGQAIGGGIGRAFTGVAALGFGTKNDKGVTSDLTGVGGRLQTLLQPLAETFGNGGQRIAGKIGAAAGGAATGSVISGIGDALGIKNSKAGAQIGGAIGGVAASFGLPGGEIIGSILGGLVGGLFGPKGSTTISASAGKVSSSGTGSAAVQKATGAIGNTVTDALQSIADQLGGTIGDFSVSIGKKKGQFRIDSSGAGKLNGSTVTGTDSESEALTLAIADALKDGAIKTSPRVQSALLAYADNVNKAVSEALKVKGLEDLLADRNNPFLSTFRTLETQLKQRVDVAKKYGFDLVQIEKVNGDDRAKALKDTLASATGSVRSLLTDLTIGGGATGSATQRLAGLSTERDRLTALARGGDTGQLDAIASIVKQIDDLQKETFGSTAGFASGRADSVSLLNDLIKQTEDRAKAAADQAKDLQKTTVDKLSELNASADDQYAVQSDMKGLQADMKALLASIDQRLAGGGSFALAGQYARTL